MAQRLFRRNNKKAQALLELAVFGIIIISLLGVLISYGLRYNFQQQVSQQTFRKALDEAQYSTQDGRPKVTSQIVIKDTHIPNPGNIFGMGAVTPVMSSVTVTRDFQQVKSTIPEDPYNITPSEYNELPEVEVTVVGGSHPHRFKTEGYRIAWQVPDEAIDRYLHIYGSGSVKKLRQTCTSEYPHEDDPEYKDPTDINNDPDSGYVNNNNCQVSFHDLLLIDNCDGEIIDYDVAVSRCRKIVDKRICQDECEQDLFEDPDTDCATVCGHDMEIPWYCATENGRVDLTGHGDPFNFVTLNKLFKVTPATPEPTRLGLQTDYTQDTTSSSTLQKTETASGITTTESPNWQVDTKRIMIYRDFQDTSGNPAAPAEETSRVSENNTTTWHTDW